MNVPIDGVTDSTKASAASAAAEQEDSESSDHNLPEGHDGPEYAVSDAESEDE